MKLKRSIADEGRMQDMDFDRPDLSLVQIYRKQVLRVENSHTQTLRSQALVP